MRRSLNAPAVAADTQRKGGWCCGGGRPVDSNEQLNSRRRSDARDLRSETDAGPDPRATSLPGSTQ